MKKLLLLPVLIISMLILFIGCENDISNGPIHIVDPEPDPEPVGEITCLDCHSSEEMLQEALGEEGAKVTVTFKGDG